MVSQLTIYLKKFLRSDYDCRFFLSAEENLIQRHNDSNCLALVQKFLDLVPHAFLQKFCRLFLL